MILIRSDNKWSNLKAASEERRKALEDIVNDLQDFKESGDSLGTWLAQKDKMVAVLGPLATESTMIDNQLEQVKVANTPLFILKDRFFSIFLYKVYSCEHQSLNQVQQNFVIINYL